MSELYYKTLIDKLYKCLCLFEEKNEGLVSFIHSLAYEIYGLQYHVKEKELPIIESLTVILEHLYDDSLQVEYDLTIVRREIFHCMDLIKKLEGVK